MKKNLIAGAWTGAADATSNSNPSDLSDVIGDYADASVQDVADAVSAAHAAFASWARTSPEYRSDILDRASAEILARKEELGRLLSREEGKTLAEGIGEVTRAGRIFRYFAGEALRITGERLDSVRDGIDVEILREPEGVIGVVTPWNFPIAIPAWKIAPALAYGNTVVFKPAELVPACAWELADILNRAGLPAGVLNLVMGRGAVVGEAIVRSPLVRAISFTGSVRTGRQIRLACMENGKKMQMEMGGKNPLIICSDADLDTAVSVAINGSYFSTGQRCTASSRIIVEAGVHDRFVERMIAQLADLRIDHALDPATDIGPVVSETQFEQDIDYIRIGQSEGANLAFGGKALERKTKGYFLEPALFTDTNNGMRINWEEIFGPVASVIRAGDYEEAVSIANDTAFGLSSGICTTSLSKMNDFKHRSAAGMVMVNTPTAGVDYHVPFGGRKSSSHGPREQGAHARDFYTSLKTVYVTS
ncbi:aldehyde dehydrogenase family protein [Roseovarius sp.]|uniref:aldehyde dehydrogenase family protein n=1 Tax=Roseovarius sp. TaxID=1486281 RepID=UPI003B598CD5